VNNRGRGGAVWHVSLSVAFPGGLAWQRGDCRRGLDNGAVRVLTGSLTVVTVLAGAALVGGCGGPATSATTPSGSASAPATDAGSPADRLAGLVAAAADHRYTATYQYTPTGRTARTVTVALANDGSWLVGVPGGGLGGGRDVAVAGNAAGVYQCGLGGTASSCVRVANAGGRVPAGYDPQVESIFTTWVPALGNRQAALSIATAPAPAHVPGSCFSVEPTAASLSSPVPPGVYCLNADGVVTGAQLALGTLALTGAPAAAPATVTLPAAMAASGAVPTASPPPSPAPSLSPSTSRSPSPSAR
jgi:hypothetical protein